MSQRPVQSLLPSSRPRFIAPEGDEARQPSRMLEVTLEMVRSVLGGDGAWLLQAGIDTCKVLQQSPEACCPLPLKGRTLFDGRGHAADPRVVLSDGSHGVRIEVLRQLSSRDTFYLVVVQLPFRMRLGEREKGLLDGLSCAVATACLQHEAEQQSMPLTDGHLVCCASCRRVRVGRGGWLHWDHLPDRQAFTKPVSHTVCEACAVKLYGLAMDEGHL